MLWGKRHKSKSTFNEYLLSEARFVPDATRIPENVVYSIKRDEVKLYNRKVYDFPVEVKELDWLGMQLKVVVKKGKKPASTLDFVDSIISGDAEVLDIF